jgi:hypothetical protein
MLNSLACRRELARVCCAITGRSLTEDILEGGLGEAIRFRPEDASLVVHNDGIPYSCDGEQKIDVLCTGIGHAIAFESKLGETRMGIAEFRKRFRVRCEKSKHSDSRLSGSMIAVLERSFPFANASHLVAHLDDSFWTVAEPWWLVVRESILDKWRRHADWPVTSARVLSFDSLAQVYGSRQQFDQLVQRVVGTDFAGRWRISLTDP